MKNIWDALENDGYISFIYRGCRIVGGKDKGKWFVSVSGRRVLLEELYEIASEFIPPETPLVLVLPVKENYYLLREL